MLYFPKPYPGELLYSILARCAVHTGTISPKNLLDDLYKDRKVLATTDLPCHIDQLLRNVGGLWPIDPIDLIYEHTLMPLYAPFVTEERRQKCISMMRGEYGGAIHLLCGVSASVVKQPKFMQFCPDCAQENIEKFGEAFWHRIWQVPGMRICLKHKISLVNTDVLLHETTRHQYFPLRPKQTYLPRVEPSAIDFNYQKTLVLRLNELLSCKPQPSPTFSQWTTFYKHLAAQNDLNRGKQIDLNVLRKRFLATTFLPTELRSLDWLPMIFRKHRKAFSFLCHLYVWNTLLQKKSTSDILKDVINESSDITTSLIQNHKPEIQNWPKRRSWKMLLTSYEKGPKWVRNNVAGAKKQYSWLYKHDRSWLLKTNKKYPAPKSQITDRIQWSKRDQQIVRELIKYRKSILTNTRGPRRTQTWYISYLKSRGHRSISLKKMPLCQSFFDRYCETVEDYQIRRCATVVLTFLKKQRQFNKCEIQRKASVPDGRIKPATEKFVNWVVGEYGTLQTKGITTRSPT